MKRPAAVLVSLSLVVLPDWVAGAVASQVSFPAIDGNAVLQHIKVLSSDRFEGRAPGANGEELTVPYWEDQFKKLGLKPGNTDGTYIQKVPMVGITPDPTMTLTFKKRSAEDQLRYLDDFVAWTRHVAPTAAL